ncbi:hypothetical protein K0M31_017925 [Melipona bicolor]|uniref:Uncharacterized protein n=1 Tax=Melipona bicolor TaxID=60889 RepID=A0AA40G5V6_9HYME|nr:hypothetical protein K0M31_017925 [Melipona bicolor]
MFTLRNPGKSFVHERAVGPEAVLEGSNCEIRSDWNSSTNVNNAVNTVSGLYSLNSNAQLGFLILNDAKKKKERRKSCNESRKVLSFECKLDFVKF